MPKRKLCMCGDPHDDWPADDGTLLCQMYWEAECSKSWWIMVQALAEGEEREPPSTTERTEK